MKLQIENQTKEIASLAQQLSDAKAELDRGRQELEEGRNELASKKKEAYGEWKVRRTKSKDFQDHFTCINILTSKA